MQAYVVGPSEKCGGSFRANGEPSDEGPPGRIGQRQLDGLGPPFPDEGDRLSLEVQIGQTKSKGFARV